GGQGDTPFTLDRSVRGSKRFARKVSFRIWSPPTGAVDLLEKTPMEGDEGQAFEVVRPRPHRAPSLEQRPGDPHGVHVADPTAVAERVDHVPRDGTDASLEAE